MNSIARLLHPEDVLLMQDAEDKLDVLAIIGRHMEGQHGMNREWVASSLLRREQLCSTGLGQGFAIPHARVAQLQETQLAYLRLRTAIPFEAPDRRPVYEMLVILVPKRASDEHLRILADATEMFSDTDFRRRLERCTNAAEITHTFKAWGS